LTLGSSADWWSVKDRLPVTESSPCSQSSFMKTILRRFCSCRKSSEEKFTGPYCHDDRRYYFWRLTGKSLQASLPLFAERLPESRKRQQFAEWIERYGLAEILTIMSELERVDG
jgi:hypothetical protein